MGRASFNKQLSELHAALIDMGCVIEAAIEQASIAFKTHNLDLCKLIIEGDHAVNEMEKSIESKCLWLIAREQPVASDLRKITTALKIITDMERIGDHAVDIAQITLRQNNAFSGSVHIPQMAAAAIDMVRDAIKAYVNHDMSMAEVTAAKDDIVDDYFRQIKGELVTVFREQPEYIDSAIDLLLIAKYLERIADHAVNICEWVCFSQTGKHKKTLIF